MARRKIGAWYRLAVTVLRPVLMASTRRDWRGAEYLPRSGGFVVCVNHISHADPFTFTHFLYDNGFLPRFLTKEALFRTFFIGRVVSGAKQIPVYRESSDASRAYSAAVQAVRAGECVAIYPDATLTRDPGMWPMRGKTGAARIALETGCPVIPVAQWGAQEILAPYTHVPHLVPRHTSHVWAGPPVDLSAFQDQPQSAEVLRGATDAIVGDITRLLEEIRGAKAPAERWNPREHDLPLVGNPRQRTRRDGAR